MKLLFFDLETTGTNPGKHGIHQISGQIVIDGIVKESFDFHVQPNPKAIIEDEALAVAGVTREQIAQYPPMATVYAQFVAMLGKYVDKFNNDAVGGGMVFNCIDWMRDNRTPKIHPTQKPVPLLEYLIRIFTDPGDVVIDPCAGSGSTLFAAMELGRRAYGFEIKKEFFKAANEKVLSQPIQPSLF